MLRYTKYFDAHRDATANYRDATLWCHERGLSPCMKEMANGGWVLTLEGAQAKRVLDAEQPVAEGGFRLREIPTYG